MASRKDSFNSQANLSLKQFERTVQHTILIFCQTLTQQIRSLSPIIFRMVRTRLKTFERKLGLVYHLKLLSIDQNLTKNLRSKSDTILNTCVFSQSSRQERAINYFLLQERPSWRCETWKKSNLSARLSAWAQYQTKNKHMYSALEEPRRHPSWSTLQEAYLITLFLIIEQYAAA